MEEQLIDDPHRGAKLYIMVGIAQIVYHLSQHPDISKFAVKPTDTHTPQVDAEEEHS